MARRSLRSLAAARSSVRCYSAKPQQYDLARLMRAHPPLQPHVVPRRALLEAKKGQKGQKGQKGKRLADTTATALEELTVDWGCAEAVRELNVALLVDEHGVSGESFALPLDALTPAVPGRLELLKTVGALLAEECGSDGAAPTGPGVKVLDVGVGASAVYPLIGAAQFGWSFVGVDVDEEAMRFAERNLRAADCHAELRLQRDRRRVLGGGVLGRHERFAATVCNPPFYANAEEAAKATRRKLRNLGGARSGGSTRQFGGRDTELFYPLYPGGRDGGGERGFVATYIRESAAAPQASCWFTSLVSAESSLRKLRKTLAAVDVEESRELGFSVGNKRARVVAWTFLPREARREAARLWRTAR